MATKRPIKANGKQTRPKADTIKTFKDAHEAIEQGIVLFENLQQKIEAKYERATQLVNEIRQLCIERGITMPELDQIVKESNQLQVYSAKLKRYVHEVRNESAEMDRRIAILATMVELGSRVDVTSKNIDDISANANV